MTMKMVYILYLVHLCVGQSGVTSLLPFLLERWIHVHFRRPGEGATQISAVQSIAKLSGAKQT